MNPAFGDCSTPPPAPFVHLAVDVRLDSRRRCWTLWGPPIVEMALIFAASSISQVPAAPGGISDKLIHALVYGVLAGLFVRALARGRWVGVRMSTVLTSVALATVYGVSDELHQVFVPMRSPELADVTADAAGAAVAASALWAWSILARTR